MLGEIIVKIFTPSTTPTSPAATAASTASTSSSSMQSASSQANGEGGTVIATPTPTSTPAVAAALPSTSNAYDELVNADIGMDDGTYTQLPPEVASPVEATQVGDTAALAITDVQATASSRPDIAANAIDAPATVIETAAEVADVFLTAAAEQNDAKGQTSNGPSGPVNEVALAPVVDVPLNTVRDLALPSSGQTEAAVKLAQTVSSVGALTPTQQVGTSQVAHTSSTRAAAQSQPEIRISTGAKTNSSGDDALEALKKSVQDQQKLASLQGVVGSTDKVGEGALFLLGQQSSQTSRAADLVSILYSQH